MEGHERIGVAFERNARALALKPSLGQGTATTRIRVTHGFRCDVEDGPWTLASDMGAKSGGDDSAPNPGVIGRAALGTCLATAYVMWAAKLGVPLDSLEVEVQADYDARGYHGVDGVKPGYEEIRYVVSVSSPASEEEVQNMLDVSDEHCDFLHVFRDPQTVKREVRITAGRS